VQQGAHSEALAGGAFRDATATIYYMGQYVVLDLASQCAEGTGGMAHKNAGKTVTEILIGKKGSIKNAPLPPGSPSWKEVGPLTWEEIVAKAEAGEPGYGTIKKLLGEKRFDK
jgi:hypothetical protein